MWEQTRNRFRNRELEQENNKSTIHVTVLKFEIEMGLVVNREVGDDIDEHLVPELLPVFFVRVLVNCNGCNCNEIPS